MRIFTLGKLRDRRRDLRKDSTPEEAILWEQLRGNRLGIKFRRQHSIGPYIADFYCPTKKLVIELDGSEHLNSREYDLERTRYFESLGITVIRFWNKEIQMNIDDVISKIKTAQTGKGKSVS